jgi:hypothetical protein
MSPEEQRLAALSNAELVEELAAHELLTAHNLGELWVEIGLRLGVEGLEGILAATRPGMATGEQAERLRRLRDLWAGQPEAER